MTDRGPADDMSDDVTPGGSAGFLEEMGARLRDAADRVRCRPDDATGHADHARQLLLAGRPVEAVAAADRALALDDGLAVAWRDRGVGLQAQGRLRQAEDAFAQALQRDPGLTEVHANLGDIAVLRGETDKAIDAYRRVAPASPHFAASAANAAHLLARSGRAAEAGPLFRAALAADPSDRAGAALGLSKLGEGAAAVRMPEAYVEALFDGYAGHFDRALRDNLSYRVPEQLVELVDSVLTDGDPRRNGAGGGWTVFDAGCGTGLCAPALGSLLRPGAGGSAGVIDGADLSAEMLARAAARGYRQLIHGDAAAALKLRPDSYDLVIAADMLVYVGDPGEFLSAAAGALRPGGMLAFSVETLAGADGETVCRLNDELRFAHGEPALRAALDRAGLDVARRADLVVRTHQGAPVAGTGFVAIRRNRATV